LLRYEGSARRFVDFDGTGRFGVEGRRSSAVHRSLIGAIPTWPHSRSWGYAPSGALGLVVMVIIVLLLLGRL
jgi:Protein of unknown function (DUF3309)